MKEESYTTSIVMPVDFVPKDFVPVVVVVVGVLFIGRLVAFIAGKYFFFPVGLV